MLNRGTNHFIIFDIHPVIWASHDKVLVSNFKSLEPEKPLFELALEGQRYFDIIRWKQGSLLAA